MRIRERFMPQLIPRGRGNQVPEIVDGFSLFVQGKDHSTTQCAHRQMLLFKRFPRHCANGVPRKGSLRPLRGFETTDVGRVPRLGLVIPMQDNGDDKPPASLFISACILNFNVLSFFARSDRIDRHPGV